MISLQRLAAAGALAATLTLAGCSDSLSPDTVDPQALAGNVNGVVYTFESNAALGSMLTLAPNFPSYNASALALVRATSAVLDAAAHHGTLTPQAQQRLLASVRGTNGVEQLFPANILGKTIEWDADSGYYLAREHGGEPANGIRLILYVADPNTGTPYLPLTQIGHIDITDESSASANKIGVLVKTVGGETVADYDITATVISLSSVAVTAAGYVRSGDGTEQANFNISFTATQTSATVHAVIVGSDGTAIEVTLTFAETTATFDFAVARDHNTIAVHATENLNTATVVGNVKFNGTVVALISGSDSDPVFTPAEGFNLSGEDIQTLLNLFQQVGEFVSKFIDAVFAPAGIVFGGGISV